MSVVRGDILIRVCSLDNSLVWILLGYPSLKGFFFLPHILTGNDAFPYQEWVKNSQGLYSSFHIIGFINLKIIFDTTKSNFAARELL